MHRALLLTLLVALGGCSRTVIALALPTDGITTAIVALADRDQQLLQVIAVDLRDPAISAVAFDETASDAATEAFALTYQRTIEELGVPLGTLTAAEATDPARSLPAAPEARYSAVVDEGARWVQAESSIPLEAFHFASTPVCPSFELVTEQTIELPPGLGYSIATEAGDGRLILGGHDAHCVGKLYMAEHDSRAPAELTVPSGAPTCTVERGRDGRFWFGGGHSELWVGALTSSLTAQRLIAPITRTSTIIGIAPGQPGDDGDAYTLDVAGRISRVVGSERTVLDQVVGLNSMWIARDADGALVIATDSALVYYRHEQIERLPIPRPPFSGYISAARYAPSLGMVVGDNEAHVAAYQNGTWRSISPEDDLYPIIDLAQVGEGILAGSGFSFDGRLTYYDRWGLDCPKVILPAEFKPQRLFPPNPERAELTVLAVNCAACGVTIGDPVRAHTLKVLRYRVHQQ